MRVGQEELPDVNRYLARHRDEPLEGKERHFQTILRRIRRVRPLDGSCELLEVGIGTGWFPILCARAGLRCKGLEISPQLAAHARELGRRYGAEPDIEVGNIEDFPLGAERYDAVIAQSTFEHVERWRQALANIFRALKPGGLLYFYSTNKFMLWRSGEYRFPFYGWLPDRWRYRLRIARQGPEIMRLGIDFNQFTWGQLRRAFRRLGFARVLDPLAFIHPDDLNRPTFWKRALLRTLRALPPVKHLALTFLYPGTYFICVKQPPAGSQPAGGSGRR